MGITTQMMVSIIISICLAIGFIIWQFKEYKSNIESIGRLENFFSKKDKYSTCDEGVVGTDRSKFESGLIIKNVANKNAELKSLINDINDYIRKSKGTVAFSIIQNKTERRISMLYENATSNLSFPTHIGLMGTFAGVFIGLSMFLIGTWHSGEITDDSIKSLIAGVLVSMITSFCGIRFLIKSNKAASKATNRVDKDKNEFYEWVQNELMPSVDVSMVEAIGKLHETIDKFEPTFSNVIAEFKEAFEDVTGAFGNDFRESVKVVASAVDTMGLNIDKVNDNIENQQELLSMIESEKLANGLTAFVEASSRFGKITSSLELFDRARRLMLIAAQETINLQKDFNENLQVPKQIATEIKGILNRITTFEDSINNLGENIASTQLIGNTMVNQIEANINAINKKQEIVGNYSNAANKQLEEYLKSQNDEMESIMRKHNEAFDKYLDDYELMLKERKAEFEQRNSEFIEVINQKLSIEKLQAEFSNLDRLNEISRNIEQLAQSPVDGRNLKEVLSDIRDGMNASSRNIEQLAQSPVDGQSLKEVLSDIRDGMNASSRNIEQLAQSPVDGRNLKEVLSDIRDGMNAINANQENPEERREESLNPNLYGTVENRNPKEEKILEVEETEIEDPANKLEQDCESFDDRKKEK